MRLRIKQPEKTARYLVVVTLSVMVVWGLVSVVFECRPFWVDEWRVIYNLKFKTVEGLWGKLAFMQQFPRVYLSILKYFTETRDYDYFSLRLPSYLVGLVTIASIYRLAGKLYPSDNYNRFILVMMLLSCGTFTEYFVQIKQYTMELLLCVVGLWQLRYLLMEGEGRRMKVAGYVFLCLSFLAAPFFSYTYPLVVAPIYAVILLQDILLWKTELKTREKIIVILRQWFPLFICTFSVTLFYFADIAQLTRDGDMKQYWGHLMMDKGFDMGGYLVQILLFFGQVGAGALYFGIFCLLGIMSFVYGVYRSFLSIRAGKTTAGELLIIYSVLLLLVVFGLSAAGKLPLGEPRLNAFPIPAISLLIIALLEAMKTGSKTHTLSGIISFILIVGLCGNIYSTVAASVTGEKYERRLKIYQSTQVAIREANAKKLPILVTNKVAYPYEDTPNLPHGGNVPGDWVLMTFPAYSAMESMPVYAIADNGRLEEYLKQLPVGTRSAMVGDGINYRIVRVGD